MSVKTACPDCHGAGETHAFVHDGQGCRYRVIDCFRCSGEGTVPREMLDWIEAGQKMRAARVESGISLREAAKQRGMTATELSRMERGYVEPFDKTPRGAGGTL